MVIDRIKAALDRDPAAHGFWGVIEIVLTYAGFHALLLHDIAHFLHRLRIPLIPRIISQTARFLTGIEIHPGAKIGRNVFIDHGAGVVIGETAEVGEGTTIFQGVTLGGTGKQSGKRHPTIGRNVVIGVGAAVLGNVMIGDDSYIGAGAVVLKDIPPSSTAVGVPARTVKMEGRRVLGATLDHTSLPDPVLERLLALQEELERAEHLMEMEIGLPHVLLAMSVTDLDTAREKVERYLTAHRLSYAVHESDTTLRISAVMTESDYGHIRGEIEKETGLSVTSEGRETGDEEAERQATATDHGEHVSGGRIMKVAIVLTVR